MEKHATEENLSHITIEFDNNKESKVFEGYKLMYCDEESKGYIFTLALE
jgi:hypothetical protein